MAAAPTRKATTMIKFIAYILADDGVTRLEFEMVPDELLVETYVYELLCMYGPGTIALVQAAS